MADYCTADLIDTNVECSLPEGHEGDHEGTVTWANTGPPPVSLVKVSPAWAMFLRSKYGALTNG